MKVLLKVVTVAMFALLSATALGDSGDTQKATATYGHYYYYSDGMVILKEAESTWLESDGGSGSYDVEIGGVKFCSAKSGMICVVGGMEETFAVPRKTLAVDEGWTFNGAAFMVLPCVTTMAPGGMPVDTKPMISMRVLGIDVSFYVIAEMGLDGKYPVRLYYFSPDRGLIGEASPAENEPIHAPLLQEAYGPGSKEFDNKISPAAILTDDEFKKMLNEPLMKRELPKKRE